MGDRGNIVVDDGSNKPVFLYTHWCGTELPQILQRALKRGRGRWGDTPYLTRIIFSEMIRNDVLEETGYGISTSMCDNEHNILYVDGNYKAVLVLEADWKFEGDISKLKKLAEFTFDQYIELNLSEFDEYSYEWKLDGNGRFIKRAEDE